MAEYSGGRQNSPVVSKRPPPGTLGVKRNIKKQPSSGSFEILPPDGEAPKKSGSAGTEGRHSRNTSSPVRSNSASGRVQSGRRSNTPTKQVSLQAVKRKEEKDEDLGDFNWEEHERLEKEKFAKMNGHKEDTNTGGEPITSKDLDGVNGATAQVASGIDKMKLTDASSQEGTSDDDSESEEEEKIKAPNDLICEFLTCIMDNDWENAKKLCKMILIYEPDNKEAKEYQPLIEEMIRQEAEEEDESDDSDEESDSDDDDDDDDDSGSDETSAEESSEEVENKKESKSNAKGDSSSSKWVPTNTS